MKRIAWFLLIPIFFLATLTSQAQQRKGWSPQGKGAAIGGAAGILGGALIGKKNRVVGGLIGGAVGAGAGYAVGKHIDNKHKKAAALAAERAAANQRLVAANARADAAERARTATAQAKREAQPRPVLVGGGLSPAATATTLAATAGAATALAATPTEVVAAGYFPNPQYGVAGTAYPASEVRRKSW
ncbi:MAG: glycine zipper domain-containing protein [Janthinobacterium lividum]